MWLELILGEKINTRVYLYHERVILTVTTINAILVCTVDACCIYTWSSSFTMTQVRKEMYLSIKCYRQVSQMNFIGYVNRYVHFYIK